MIPCKFAEQLATTLLLSAGYSDGMELHHLLADAAQKALEAACAAVCSEPLYHDTGFRCEAHGIRRLMADGVAEL
jgi:hypothetical protein